MGLRGYPSALPDETRAFILERRAARRSYGDIARALEKRDMRTARGLRTWTRSGVRQVVVAAEREAAR